MISIKSGGLLRKDPDADEPFFMDWGDERLGTGVGIATSTWTATGLTTHDAAIGNIANNVFTSAAFGRVTKVHLSGGTLGTLYTVTNSIDTDETPSRSLDASFTVLIEQE